MVHNVDLYRAKCYFCPLPAKYDNRVPYHANLACAQILRTSKQIYSETLPILYSKNMVHIKCLECEKGDYLRMKSSPFWPCLVEGNDITTELIEHFHPHVKHIATACRVEQFKVHNPIAAIPARWPMMEHEILARYKNIERIRLRTRVWFVADATFDLVRRSYKSTAERVYDYKSVLALEPKVRTSALAVLEQICDEVILSHAQGQLKNTQFAVQSIRWKPSGHTKEIVLYLGCEHHCASDTANNQLLAGPDLETRSVHSRQTHI